MKEIRTRPGPTGHFPRRQRSLWFPPAYSKNGTVTSSFSSVLLYSFVRVLLGILLVSSCATPMMPGGGPPDQTPPSISASEPASNAVNVSTQSVRLVFSEYVDQASFARALSITPSVEGRPIIRWRRHAVTIRLQDSLRQNTTYIITLDTNLRDVHGVSLNQPATLAFSTGPTINKGRLTGLVVDAGTGDPFEGIDVFAYAAADSILPDLLPDTPAYRTQTDASGEFSFSYLNERPYYVVAVRDQNRNRIADPLESFAVPSLALIHADTAVTTAERRWIVTRKDTIPPELQRIRSVSNRRHQLRFSEPVSLSGISTANWAIQDSLTQQAVSIHSVYMLPPDEYQVFILTDTLRLQTHILSFSAVIDSSGNAIRPDNHYFSPVEEADTLQLRFTGFLPDVPDRDEQDPHTLLPDQASGIQLNQTVADTLLHRAIVVRDTTGQVLPFQTSSSNGTSYSITIVPPAQPVEIFSVSVDGRFFSAPDTVYTQTYQLTSDAERGELSGYIVSVDTPEPIVLELFSDEQIQPFMERKTQADTTGYFIFEDLIESTYRLRAFLDTNGNGRWDGGTISPFEPAEAVLWNTEPLPTVRARWNTTIEDTLRFQIF